MMDLLDSRAELLEKALILKTISRDFSKVYHFFEGQTETWRIKRFFLKIPHQTLRIFFSAKGGRGTTFPEKLNFSWRFESYKTFTY